MFGLTFANPALWAGAFALGLPVVVHLMTRRTPVRFKFPTIRFLREAKANQSRIYRVRHWLMLALRTLALAFIFFAFLRPEYRARALVQQPNENATHAAIVLIDTSLSMRYAAGGFSAFSRAKVVAEGVLDGLDEDDLAGVIFIGSRPEAVFDDLRQGTGALKEAIEERGPGFGRADVDAAIALALRQLEVHPDSPHEIHLVSDFQRTNWASVNFAAVPDNVQLVFESIGIENAGNAGIVEAALNPPYPVAGEPVQLTVKVANYSDAPQDIPVSVRIGDRVLPPSRAAVAARASTAIQFNLEQLGPTTLEGEATIPDDGLSADGIRRFTVAVTDRTPVLILTDNTSNGPEAAHRFLRAALDPLEGRRTMFAPRVLTPDVFDRGAAGSAHVVIVAQVQAFSEATARALVQYLREGGGLIYFLSEPSDAANLALLESVSEKDFTAPFVTGRLIDTAGGDGPIAMLQQANYEHAALRKFRDTGALASLQFYRYFSTTRREAQGQLLLQFDNGHAALAHKTLGLGSVMLANFAADARGSSLPKEPVFLPFVHELVKAVRPSAGGGRSFVAGEPAAATVRLPAPDAAVRFSDPSGREVSAGLDVNGTEATVIFSAPDTPGFWRILAGSQAIGAVPVNVDSRESDLTSLNVDQLRELTKLSKERFLAEQGVDLAGLTALRHGLPFWHYLMIAAAAALALEQLFAWKWKR